MRKWLLFGLLLIIQGCGGGSSTPAPPANRAPTITSAATVSTAENVPGAIYTATATDPDSTTLTFSLSGGADRAAFQISASGALSFVTPRDFETPTDVDTNNVYLVQLSVTDGQATATRDVTVTVTDAFQVRRVATGFVQPLYVTAVPNTAAMPNGIGRVFVVEKGGRILILTPSTGAVAATPFLDVSASISTDGERGLLGLALSPIFAGNGTFYVYLTNPLGDIEVRRYTTLAGNRDRADPASADVILTIPHRTASNHNGGWIEFGPDRMLYLGVGDGGGSGDPANNAQNPALLLGKLLRIDPTRDDYPADPSRDYAIPLGNPFATSGGAPEIWALGLRNPFRNSFDQVGANLWIGDVGQDAREEIDLMRPIDGGANFGWPVLEGTRPFRGTTGTTLTAPVTEYEHGTGPREGSSVTGGYVYRGPVEGLRGQYFFGDFVTGNIWSFPISRASTTAVLPSSEYILRRTDFTPNAGAIGNIASFGVDEPGNLYIVDIDGEIFRLEND